MPLLFPIKQRSIRRPRYTTAFLRLMLRPRPTAVFVIKISSRHVTIYLIVISDHSMSCTELIAARCSRQKRFCFLVEGGSNSPRFNRSKVRGTQCPQFLSIKVHVHVRHNNPGLP
ncbi:hypothetical protein Plhal304r1_c008g0031621 [Plasmopara halstedii]